MPLQAFPDFLKLLNLSLIHVDADQDEATVQAYVAQLSDEAKGRLATQLQSLIQRSPLPLETIGAESNHWFGSDEEAKAWLEDLSRWLGPGSEDGSNLVVKDSNGAVLLEGDSVTVIKDLKVKGGSSDLKRGTLVKKIHLTSDPALIECKVGGTTLVLRTEFLKKS